MKGRASGAGVREISPRSPESLVNVARHERSEVDVSSNVEVEENRLRHHAINLQSSLSQRLHLPHHPFVTLQNLDDARKAASRIPQHSK